MNAGNNPESQVSETTTSGGSKIKKKRFDDLYKIVLIGDSGVGKSCLLLRFADDTFTDNYYSTIGVDFRFKCVNVNGKFIKLQIWDTAGQERFKTVTSAYYRGADGIIIVYDQTDKQSFLHLSEWLGDIEKYSTDNPTKIIISNKYDLSEQKQVSDDDAKAFTNKTGIEIIETSAKSAFQVAYAFEKLTQKLQEKRENMGDNLTYKLIPAPLEGKFNQRRFPCCNK